MGICTYEKWVLSPNQRYRLFTIILLGLGFPILYLIMVNLKSQK